MNPPTDAVLTALSVGCLTPLFFAMRQTAIAQSAIIIVGAVPFVVVAFALPKTPTWGHSTACYGAWYVWLMLDFHPPAHLDTHGAAAFAIGGLNVFFGFFCFASVWLQKEFENRRASSYVYTAVVVSLAVFFPVETILDSSEAIVVMHSYYFLVAFGSVVYLSFARGADASPLYVLCCTLWSLVAVVDTTYLAYFAFAVAAGRTLVTSPAGSTWGPLVVPLAPPPPVPPRETDVEAAFAMPSEYPSTRSRKAPSAKRAPVTFDFDGNAPIPRPAASREVARAAPAMPSTPSPPPPPPAAVAVESHYVDDFPTLP